MKLYDTSSKKNIPLKSKKIKIYVCGPTVYSDVHIGNIRPLIIFDVLYRYLLFKKIEVNYVSNITDIDDKIIDQAILRNQSELDLSNYYFNKYLKILNLLNIKLPNSMPKVSEYIIDIKKFISSLIKKGFGYKLEDGIYFDISKIKNYGLISNMNIEKNVSQNKKGSSKKRNEADFALWKFTKKGITWDFEHGKGRPGWHTECIVLVNKFLGKEIDIHGGGIDLRFPHHENENAQSLAFNGNNLSKIWMHVGHLMVNENKMAKSLGNFIKAKDLLKKYSSNSIKWMFFQINYSKPFNYYEELISNATISINKIEHDLNRAKAYLIINNFLLKKSNELNSEIEQLFGNNLNLPEIVSYIFNTIKNFSNLIKKKNWQLLEKKYCEIILILNILGISFKNLFSKDNILLIKDWKKSVDLKDFEKADKTRLKLISKKIL